MSRAQALVRVQVRDRVRVSRALLSARSPRAWPRAMCAYECDRLSSRRSSRRGVGEQEARGRGTAPFSTFQGEVCK